MVLQEKALKFMVRRRCRPGNGGGSGVGGIANVRPGPPARGRSEQQDPGPRPAAGAPKWTVLDGAPGRLEGVAERSRGWGSAAPPSCG